MTAAFRGGWSIQRGDAATGSSSWTDVGEILGVSGLGQTADDQEVTNHESGDSREYIAGLKDGSEVTIESNLIIANAMQQAMTTDAAGGNSWEFRVPITDGSDTVTITFIGVVKSWNINPSFEEQNKIQWVAKMSGAPTIVYS